MGNLKTISPTDEIQTINEIDFEVDRRNNRLIVTDNETVPPNVPAIVMKYAKEKGLEKILVTCHKQNASVFQAAGFDKRAVIRGFFRGKDAFFYTAFKDGHREISLHEKEEDAIIEKCMQKKPGYKPHEVSYEIRECTENDIPQMIELFETVFETYPTRIFDADYLKKSIKSSTLYKAAIEKRKIISIASADMNNKYLNAEITDCATYPAHRGRGLLSVLIHSLEQELKTRGFITVYSLSRSMSTGINMVFRKHGYDYNGRLINHCDICGKYEDLNIWSKTLKCSFIRS